MDESNVRLEVELADGDDVLRISSDTVEGIAAVWPACADNPYLARFLNKGQIGRTLDPREWKEEQKQDDPGPIGTQTAAEGVVRRVSASDVMAAAPRRNDKLSHSEAIADGSRPAGPGQRMLAERIAGPLPEGLTVDEARAIIREANERPVTSDDTTEDQTT